MSSDSYTTIILISILFHLVNIINLISLLKDPNYKSFVVPIISGLLIILTIQIVDFFNKDYEQLEFVLLSPFELISLIGSIILFLILITLLFVKKYESQQLNINKNYYYKPIYEFTKVETNSEQIRKEQISSSPKKEFEEKTKEQIKSEPAQSTPLQQKKQTEVTSLKVETSEHLQEKPTNGKAYVAKFIKHEEPRSEIEKIKDELEKAKFQRDKLVSIISHDLRTPLTSVFGYCQLLMDGQYKNKKEVKQFAENIFELSKQQLNALSKIIEWIKYESSNLGMHPTEFDISSTINFVTKSMSKIAEQKNIKIVVHSKPEMYVYGDEFMIIEVLKNLLDNAIKFSHPDSTIEIHAHYHEKLNKLVVLVVDSGIGIDREILMNLLVSTKKYTKRGTKGEKGLGLGLLIVKAILDKHGEHFWIASEEGKWTRVYFTLKPTKVLKE